MTFVTARQSISLDGYTAGLNQRYEEPFGDGGMPLAAWQFEIDQAGREGDRAIFDEVEVNANIGAYIMGRNMFGPGRGDWDLDWTGWWGEEPPYHAPVFVLSNHPREPLTMKGGTTFNFVTDGIESALQQARAAAGDRKVAIAGGANTIRQYLIAGLLDELYLHIVPITLGRGERLLQGVQGIRFEPVNVVASPTVTHIKYRVLNGTR